MYALNGDITMNTTRTETSSSAMLEDVADSREGKVFLTKRDRTRSGIVGARASAQITGQLRYFAIEVNEYGFSESVSLAVANNGRLLKVSSLANGQSRELVVEKLTKVELHVINAATMGLHFANMSGRPVDIIFESAEERSRMLEVLQQAQPTVEVSRDWRGAVPRQTWERFDVTKPGTAGMRKRRVLLTNASKRVVYVIKPKYLKATRNVVPGNVKVEEVIGITMSRVQLDPVAGSKTKLRISNCGPAHPPSSRPYVEFEFRTCGERTMFCASIALMCQLVRAKREAVSVFVLSCLMWLCAIRFFSFVFVFVFVLCVLIALLCVHAKMSLESQPRRGSIPWSPYVAPMDLWGQDVRRDQLRVFVGSWNVGDGKPPANINTWIPSPRVDAHDLYVGKSCMPPRVAHSKHAPRVVLLLLCGSAHGVRAASHASD